MLVLTCIITHMVFGVGWGSSSIDHCSLVYKIDVSVWSSLLSSLVLFNIRVCLLLNTESKS